MLKQAIKLWSLSSKNRFGINVFKHSTDKSERARYIAVAVAINFLVLLLETYLAGNMYAYAILGMGSIIPTYAYIMGSLLVVAFTFFKAGSIVFGMKTIDITLSLPVTKTAIVLARILDIYVDNLLLAFAVGIPAIIIYSIFVKASISFVVIYFIGIIFLPMIPMVASTAISAGVKAISSRMKRKSMVESLLMVLFCVGTIVFTSMSGEKLESFDQETLIRLLSTVEEKIKGVYPPATWISDAATSYDFVSLLLFVACSMAAFIILVAVISYRFVEVISELNASFAKRDFSKVNTKSSSMFMALLGKELKFYFSCSTYLVNTIIGQIMMVILAISLLVLGVDKLEAQLQLKGVVSTYLPFILAVTGSLMPATTCSISLEGKTHYLSKTLPVPTKVLYDSKLAMYYVVCAPFYFLSVILSAVAVKALGMQLVWLILVPFVFICFSGMVGLRANLLMPKFDWDNETIVVKQSASTLVGMLMGVIPILITGIVYAFAPNGIKNIVLGGMLVIVSLIGLWIYETNQKIVV